VILFTDLVGSTTLNVAAGDEAYVQLLRAHDRVVREALRRRGGVEFKHTGDGVAAWFTSARQAVRCALDLQDTLAGALHAESGVAVSVRCGVAAGDPIEERGDLFGLAVARAARICSLAEGGTVLVSDEIPPMAAGGGLRFEDRGAVELRGIPGARPVLAAFEDQR
jgi:class 3 adenylate cyclase